MRIGITGGAGFIGGHVAEVAVAMGHEVVIYDRTGKLTEPVGRMLEEKTASIFLGDVRDEVSMLELAAHVDGIIHLAACLGTQETIQNPRPAVDTNVFGGVNFLEACAQYDIPGVYIGVGNHWMENTYSISKTTVERLVRMFNKERGTRVNVVRLVNAYGPRQSVAPPFGPAKVRKITPAFVCRALTGQPIEIYGDGEQISDMVHVRDGARALVLALEKAAAGIVFPEAVEVGPFWHHNVNEVARMVIHTAKGLGYAPVEELVHLPMRPGEIPGASVTADVTTLRHLDIHYSDLVTLEVGITETVRWYAEHWLPGYLEHVKTEMDAGPDRDAIIRQVTPEEVEDSTMVASYHNPHAGGAPAAVDLPEMAADFVTQRVQNIMAAGDASKDGGVAARSAPTDHDCTDACTPANCWRKDF